MLFDFKIYLFLYFKGRKRAREWVNVPPTDSLTRWRNLQVWKGWNQQPWAIPLEWHSCKYLGIIHCPPRGITRKVNGKWRSSTLIRDAGISQVAASPAAPWYQTFSISQMAFFTFLAFHVLDTSEEYWSRIVELTSFTLALLYIFLWVEQEHEL